MKRKIKIKALLPIYAHCRFIVDKPDNWDNFNASQKREYFLQCAQRHGSLCHQCSSDIESDFELDYDEIDILSDDDFLDMLHN